MSNTLQVSGPSLLRVHDSGRSRKNASSVVGVRARRATVSCKSCSMVIPICDRRQRSRTEDFTTESAEITQERCATQPPYWPGRLTGVLLPRMLGLPEPSARDHEHPLPEF